VAQSIVIGIAGEKGVRLWLDGITLADQTATLGGDHPQHRN
jgi:hypothetical protein